MPRTARHTCPARRDLYTNLAATGAPLAGASGFLANLAHRTDSAAVAAVAVVPIAAWAVHATEQWARRRKAHR